MNDHEFSLNGASVVADLSGALWWPQERLLVVADLHLEKASSYAVSGVLLPPYDSQATLVRLAGVIERRQPRHVMALGDSFHDGDAADRLDAEAAAYLCKIVSGCQSWTWLTGNHDPAPPSRFGGEVKSEVQLGPLVFRHEPQPRAPGEVAGHLHPKVRIQTRARRISARCFVTNGRRVVLPAFGALTGGLDIRDTAIRTLFSKPPLALALGPERVHAVVVR